MFKWTDVSMVEEMESVERVVKNLENKLELVGKISMEFQAFKEETKKEIEGLKCGLLLCRKDLEDIGIKSKLCIFGGLIMVFGYYVLLK